MERLNITININGVDTFLYIKENSIGIGKSGLVGYGHVEVSKEEFDRIAEIVKQLKP